MRRCGPMVVVGMLGMALAGVARAAEPWPGEAWRDAVVLTGLDDDFRNNLSGAHWNEATRTLWVCLNGPGRFWALVPDGRGGFAVARSSGRVGEFEAPGDLEGITQADPGDDTVYVMVEGADRIRRYDVSVLGAPELINEFDIGPYVPAYNGSAGSEGIAFVPDAALAARGFVDGAGRPYTSRNGMGGLMFVAHQRDGAIYVFDLDPTDNGVDFVGRYLTARGESSGLEFDRSTNHLYVWHNTGGNTLEITDLGSSAASGGARRFDTVREIEAPKGGNLEGFALTPVAGRDGWAFITDDDNQDGAALMWFRRFAPGVEPEPEADPAVRTVEVALGGSLDDVEERADGTIYTDSSDLELVDDRGAQLVGLRFENVGVPPGAEIVDAYLQFTVDEPGAELTELLIRADARADAPPFTRALNDLSTRALTDAAVAWSPEPWLVVDDAGVRQQTPPLDAIVQELVDRPDYRPGNAMAFIITGAGRRTARSSDRTPERAPRLVIEYLEPPPEIAVVEVPIDGGMNDVEERPNGNIYPNSSDLELVTDGGPQHVGLRFEEVGVPAGAEIVDAYLQFTVDEATAGPTDLLVRGDARADVPAFTTGAYDLSRRPTTSATVRWTPAAWPAVDEAGPAQRTPPLTAIVQEIVDHPDYEPGNAMAFIITGDGRRTARSYERSPAKAPRLIIEYVVPPPELHRLDLRISSGLDDVEEFDDGRLYTDSTDLELGTDPNRGAQTVGLRFEGVGIPAGAEIVSASIQFTVDEATAAATDVVIRGEAAADAAPFSGADFDVTDRATTFAEVRWFIEPWSAGEAGDIQRTPDLVEVVQEIVDTPGYRAGNAMVFTLTGDGRRTAESYEGAPARAPTLHVEYRY